METKPAPKLDDEACAFVVQASVCFESPSAVASVMAEFGAEISVQAVGAYDPTKRAGRHLSERWRTMFKVKRAIFLADIAAIGISHKAVRLRELDRLFHRGRGWATWRSLPPSWSRPLRRWVGAYTNRRELTGGRGKPLAPAEVAPAVLIFSQTCAPRHRREQPSTRS